MFHLRNFKLISASNLTFVIGIFMLSMNKFRLEGTSVGPGEILLIIWMLSRLLLFRTTHSLARLDRTTISLLGITLVSIFAGWVSGVYLGLNSFTFLGALHDFFAYIFCAGILLTFLTDRRFEQELSSIWLTLMVITVIVFAIGLTIWLAWGNCRFIEVYCGVKFSAWAVNPNQIALYVLFLPFLVLHMANLSETSLSFFSGYFVMLILIYAIGFATGGEAIILSWFSSFCLIFILFLFKSVRSTFSLKGKRNLIISFVSFVFIMISYQMLYDNFIVPRWIKYKTSNDFFTSIKLGADAVQNRFADASQIGQIEARKKLILNGLRQFSCSPVFGLGPGPHTFITDPQDAREAHNLFIDVLLAGGLVALSAFGLFLGRICWGIWARKQYLMLAGFSALLVFSMFHYPLRQPVWWLYLIFAARAMCTVDYDHPGRSYERLPQCAE